MKVILISGHLELVYSPNLQVYFGDRTAAYDIFVLGNANDELRAMLEEDSDVFNNEIALDSLDLKFENYSNLDTVGDHIPMVGSTVLFRKLTVYPVVGIEVTRLFARIAFNADWSSSNGYYSYRITGVTFSQCCGQVVPFSTPDGNRTFSPRGTGFEFDASLSESALANLNNGGTTYFYIPENIQGEESMCTVPAQKTPSRLNYYDRAEIADNATYINVHMLYCNDTDHITDGAVTFRCYLGDNNYSDFNIRRNTTYGLTLKPVSTAAYRNTWKWDGIKFGDDSIIDDDLEEDEEIDVVF